MLKLEQKSQLTYGNLEKFSIILEELTEMEANIFKRVITNDVNCYATKIINFLINQSSFRNPDLAHRIGLIPINNNNLSIEHLNSDKMYKCEINITNNTDDYYDVFSNHIELLDSNDNHIGIYPYAENFKITQLLPKQQLHLIIYIDKNNGNEHLRYKTCKCQTFKEIKSGFKLDFLNFGIINTEKIIKSAIKLCKKYNLTINANLL